jgi:hypothetical protein
VTVLSILTTGLLTLTAPFLIAHAIRRRRAAQRRWEDEVVGGEWGGLLGGREGEIE